MVGHVDAIVQSLSWYFYWVWHGGTISTSAIEHWGESIVWVCRERIDGGGRDRAGYGNASDLAFDAYIDGRDLGAYLWIGGAGGGEGETVVSDELTFF